MPKQLVEFDSWTNIATYHDYDPGTETTRIQQVQDCQDILDFCKDRANDPEYKRHGIKTDWYHIARIPNVVIHELMTKHRLNIFRKADQSAIEKILQRDYKKLLTVNRI